MSCTVFATTMGFFSKKSGGKGVAPADVCLTAPTPPAGPVPVPYVNVTFAQDLSDGSVTVKADKGIVSVGAGKGKTKKSTGDEPGTIMTKGVVSMTNKGGAKFKTFSFTVMIEGDGVNCMGHIMDQNTQGVLLNCIDPAAIVQFAAALAQLGMLRPCKTPYSKAMRPDRDPSPEQEKAVDGKPCWECQQRPDAPAKPTWNMKFSDDKSKMSVNKKRRKMRRQRLGKTKGKEAMTHDHQPPLAVAWNMGGCHMKPSPGKFKELFEKPEMVKPHCQAHYRSQGSELSDSNNHITPA